MGQVDLIRGEHAPVTTHESLDPAKPFSVIVCTLDRPEELRQTIQSLLVDTNLMRELWIMDQSANPDAEEMIQRHFPEELCIRDVRLASRGKSRAARARDRKRRDNIRRPSK